MDNNEFDDINGPPRTFPAATAVPTLKAMKAAFSPSAVVIPLTLVAVSALSLGAVVPKKDYTVDLVSRGPAEEPNKGETLQTLSPMSTKEGEARTASLVRSKTKEDLAW
jgi:hypothetical protein